MTLKSYIWGMRSVALFSFVALGLAVYYLDPDRSGMLGQIILYSALFFFLSSFFNLFLLWVRKRTLGKESMAPNVGLSFRQGTLLAVFFIGILVLQEMRILLWWDGLLLLAGIFLAELYFLSKSS